MQGRERPTQIAAESGAITFLWILDVLCVPGPALGDASTAQEATFPHASGLRLLQGCAKSARQLASRVRSACPQASLVIIRQAPRTVQPTSQATMTQAATAVDSGTSCEMPPRLLPPKASGKPPGSR